MGRIDPASGRPQESGATMGLMDKFKQGVQGAVQDAKENATQALQKREERQELAKQNQQADSDRQLALRQTFVPTNSMGDVSIDSVHKLFMVRHASAKLPKQSGFFTKGAKATAALVTGGVSIAAEAAVKAAMKPDDRVFEFSELRSFELIEDDAQVVGGGVGMALAGGAFFGPLGAVSGAMVGGKKTKKTVENLILQMNFNNLDMPCIFIPYITKTVKVSSNDYRKALAAARETISCLELIVDNDPQPVIEVVEESVSSNDPYEELKKLKELVDMGIITQDEFDRKKQEILGM